MITNTTKNFWVALVVSIITLLKGRRTRKFAYLPILIIGIGFLLPQKMIIPVEGSSTASWDKNSFWAYPWGSSVTHKGIDIFAAKGTPALSATHGLVVYAFEGGKGGKSVMVLGPKWRFHYYAHLNTIDVLPLEPLFPGKQLGEVGATGNAAGKPPHLHYSITSPFPHWWLRDTTAVQGNRKMFYLNPDRWLRN